MPSVPDSDPISYAEPITPSGRTAPRSARSSPLSGLLTAAPSVTLIVICCALPLLWMAFVLLRNPIARAEFALDAFRVNLIWRTLYYNLSAALIATAMGLPAGFVLGRGRGPIARFLWIVLPAALLMPSLSFAYGWSQVVRLNNENLRALGIHIVPGQAWDVFRCIWSLASWLWAVPAGLIGLSLRRMDSTIQQQALLDGALLRITFRQLVGPIIASIAIVTVLATQEFAVYEPTGISVVATEVRMVFDTGALSTPETPITMTGMLGAGLRSTDQPARAAAAVAVSTPLMLATSLLAIAAAWGATESESVDALTTGDWPPILDASLWTVALTCLLVWLNIGVPVWGLVKSLHVRFSPVRMYNEFGPQVLGALLVAVESALVAGVVALSASGRWTKGLLAVAGASFLAGGQLLAIALIRIYNRPGLFFVLNCSLATVACYLGRFGWLAVAAGRGSYSRPWRELRDMASLDGASVLQTAWHIIWPLAWPTLLAGALLVGALSLTEVPATVLLMPQNPQVLTPTLMTWVHMVRFDSMIEASLLMMGTVIVPAVVAVLLTPIGLRRLKAR